MCGSERYVVVARELTKLHETFVRGPLSEVQAHYRDQQVRGEIVVIVSSAPEVAPDDVEKQAQHLARELLTKGATARDAAKQVAGATGLARNRAYEITLSISQEGPAELK